MKISAASLKNIDYKQAAIDHGEKVFIAFLGLFVLFALATTNWIPYQRTPQQLSILAEKSDEAVSNSQWPDQQRDKFAAMSPLRPEVVKMISPIDNANTMARSIFEVDERCERNAMERERSTHIHSVCAASHSRSRT